MSQRFEVISLIIIIKRIQSYIKDIIPMSIENTNTEWMPYYGSMVNHWILCMETDMIGDVNIEMNKT